MQCLHDKYFPTIHDSTELGQSVYMIFFFGCRLECLAVCYINNILLPTVHDSLFNEMEFVSDEWVY